MKPKTATRTIRTTGPGAANIVSPSKIGNAILGCRPVAKGVRVAKATGRKKPKE